MKHALLFVAAVFLSPLSAQEAAPNKPVVTLTPGQQIKAVWNDGREAELKFSRSVQNKVGVDYQVTENLCSPRNGDILKVIFPYRIDRLGWFWSKHSDPAKVGQTVVFKFGSVLDPLIRFSVVTNGYLFHHSDLVLGLPNDEMHFTDIKWLAGFETGPLKPFTISAWLSESMIRNSQTGVNENRIVSGAYNVHMKPKTDLIAEITGIDSRFVLPFVGPSFILIGDVVSWQWQNAQGPCQIAFKPNIGPAQAEVIRFLSGLNDPWNPYLHQQDSLTETVEVEFLNEELWYVE